MPFTYPARVTLYNKGGPHPDFGGLWPEGPMIQPTQHTQHTQQKLNPFESVNARVNRAGDLLGIKESYRRLLTTCWRETKVSLPVTDDKGELQVYEGYRVQHNGNRGPYKGGVRYHPAHVWKNVRG